MNTAQTWQTISTNSSETLKLAEAVGRKLRGGETIELVSDLGGGKTTFVRGLAQGLGSKDTVSSPSFTLCNEYQTGKLTLYHFDFYRLHEPGIMRDELAELIDDTEAIMVIEWAGIVEDVLPRERITVRFKTTDETDRELTFEYPEKLSYLIEDKT